MLVDVCFHARVTLEVPDEYTALLQDTPNLKLASDCLTETENIIREKFPNFMDVETSEIWDIPENRILAYS